VIGIVAEAIAREPCVAASPLDPLAVQPAARKICDAENSRGESLAGGGRGTGIQHSQRKLAYIRELKSKGRKAPMGPNRRVPESARGVRIASLADPVTRLQLGPLLTPLRTEAHLARMRVQTRYCGVLASPPLHS